MLVQIVSSEDNATVQTAVNQANEILNNETFYNSIRQKESFDLSTASPRQVADIFKATSLVFTIELFHPNFLSFRYRKTLAYTDGRYPKRLF